MFKPENANNPINAPMFCMLLRKHLTGATVLGFGGKPYERIIDISFETKNELGDTVSEHLITELMGRRSNIILTDYSGKIIDCIKRSDLSGESVRAVFPGLEYSMPESQGRISPVKISFDIVFNSLSQKMGEIAEKAIIKCFDGFSPLLARETVFRATQDTSSILTDSNIKPISQSLISLFNDTNSGIFSPCILYENDKPRDFSAVDINMYGNLFCKKTYDSMSEVLENFYFERDRAERMRQKTANIRKKITTALERCRKKLLFQEQTLNDAERKDEYKKYGELITANLYNIKEPLSDKIVLPDFYNNMEPVSIPIDKSKSISSNAQIYFTKYRKSKTAVEITARERKKNIAEIEYLESILASTLLAENEQDIAQIKAELVDGKYIVPDKKSVKKNTKSKDVSPVSVNIDGFTVYIGKNNKQNDYITLKLGRTEDMWLHVKDFPGSHILIKSDGREVPDCVLLKSAQIAAYYSNARGGSKVAVDYTKVKNVKKPSGAKPGKVIYENYKTAYVEPAKEERK